MKKVYAVASVWMDGDSIHAVFSSEEMANEVARVSNTDVLAFDVDPPVDLSLLRGGLSLWSFFWTRGKGWLNSGRSTVPVESLLGKHPRPTVFECDHMPWNRREYFCVSILAKSEEEARAVAARELNNKFNLGIEG